MCTLICKLKRGMNHRHAHRERACVLCTSPEPMMDAVLAITPHEIEHGPQNQPSRDDSILWLPCFSPRRMKRRKRKRTGERPAPET